MNRTTHNDTEDTLEGALDALARGDRRPLETLDADTRATVDQLFAWAALGGLDGIASPAPAHAAPPVSGSRSRRSTPMHATTIPATPFVPDLPKRDRRVAPAIWSAFAWVLIAALVGASIYGAAPFFRDDRPAESTMTAFQPGTATPEVASEAGEVNYGGDAGSTWYVGDVDPFTGEASVVGNLGSPSMNVMSQPLVIGDTIIATVFDPATTDDSAIQTIRYDLTTGERLWTSRTPLSGPFATDGEFVYGLTTAFFPDDPPSPGAIRLDNGDLEMGLAPWSVKPTSSPGPVVANGVACFTDAFGNVNAVDPANINTVFFPPVQIGYLGEHPERPGFGANIPETDLVMSEEWLFVVRPSKTVVKYDRRTGEELGSFNLVDTLRGEVGEVTLQVVRNRLVVTAAYADIPLEAAARPASILLYDADSLIPVARGDMPDLRSNLVVTPDWIYLAGRMDVDRPVQIYRMNPVGATFGEPFPDFAAPAEAWLGLSLSGRTLMVVGPPNLVALIDVEQRTVIRSEHVELADGDSLTVFPMQLWGRTPVTVSTGGAIVVFSDDSSQP
jgi:outer membrane protein assembly factor BamB